MPEYTLRIRRYSPESGEAAHWQDYEIDLDGHRSVLDGILQAKDRQDGSIGIRCSCRAAICGSCGVRVNGKPTLACHTHLDRAFETAPDGVITVEPMGNMPVLKDLIVDMDAVHWKKMRRVTPWLLPEGDPPEREYIVPPESMIDITQTMACIQCGACVSDCLSMEVDPLFIGPAALAKAYRFVGDPRDGHHSERLRDLAEDEHGIYDCTHCFNCIEACPKGVAPMSQIMRLRRIAGADHHIDDRNNGHRHEMAFVNNIERNGLLHEADLLPDSYGGKFHPRAVPELLSSLPVILRAVQRGKVTPAGALLHKHKASKEIKRIFRDVHDREERYELNLYVVGEEEEADSGQSDTQASAAGGHLPAERSPNT
jgi:succinate dehydrogenase / fumarate reductase iron-sulfur subunit